MPAFDRIDGQFVAVQCTFHERLIFQRAGWGVDTRLKKWTTNDAEKARPLIEYAVGAAEEYLTHAEAIKEAAVAASWAEDTDEDFPAPEGLSYMPFQKAGIAYALDGHRTLIADPPGLGKTIQAIGVHNAMKMKSVLVVCPASLKVNWSREWRRWDVHGLTVGIAMSIPRSKTVTDEETGDKFVRTWTEHHWPETDVVIVNYDMLPTFDDDVKAKKWDMVVCDEAHLLKTATTTRTMCIFGGKKKARKKYDDVKGKMVVVEKAKDFFPVEATYHLYLTGTPIMSKPIELWTLVRACDPKGLGKSWERFTEEFCGAYDDGFGRDTSGATNLDKLNQLLRERFMVRRNKESVLKELPSKTRELILLPTDKLEKPVRKEKNRVEAALGAFEAMMGISEDDNPFRYIDAIDLLSQKLTEAVAAQDTEEPDWNLAVKTLSEPEQIMFTELSAAREEVALAKVGLVTDHVKKLVECGEPVILFGYHKSVIDELRKRLEAAGIRVGVVTGAVSANKRQAVVDAFQDGEIDVIIGNILAMGVGFTLTRARFVVFAELDWVPALIEQAEDRAWRHGQKNAVLIQHLVVDGSIEARMAMALLEKMGVIFEALDAINT
ncbi:SNF2 family superfamily II DNA/RNA helicase [Roseobacter phage DSS3P8]|nr:SNF2 family superfamily II DNA/RNA helicase [Roseobacter phage DSS3P8]